LVLSSQILQVGSLAAAPGEKRYGVNEFAVQGQPYQMPMWLINGAAEGPTLVVTAGIHAAEYASIEAALDLGRSLDPAQLRGRVFVVPVINTPAFAARAPYVCPLDGKNLNRVFPGDARGTASQQIAAWTFPNVIAQADFYVDLHGGDLVEALMPYSVFFRTGNERVDHVSIEMATVFGFQYMVCHEIPGSAFWVAARAGIPSILAEAGGQGVWTPEDVGLFKNGFDRLMRHLEMIPGAAPARVPVTLLDQFLWLRSDHDGFWYPGVPVGAVVTKGQDLGRVTDVEGHVLQTAISPADGRTLFIVSSLAINRTDPLLVVGA
jgi:predicted deacylase